MAKVIILNGAPESGKDLGASSIVKCMRSEGIDANQHEFKGQLFKLTKAIYGISEELWDSWYTREGKELPRAELGGISARNALIFTSEKIMKVHFGDRYFGEFAAKYTGDVVVFSDGGFTAELEPLIEKHGFDNIAVIRIHREGCTFANDSRSFLPDGCVGTIYDLQNNMKFNDPDSPEYYQFMENCVALGYNFLTKND